MSEDTRTNGRQSSIGGGASITISVAWPRHGLSGVTRKYRRKLASADAGASV
jgi:hypothetical protein